MEEIIIELLYQRDITRISLMECIECLELEKNEIAYLLGDFKNFKQIKKDFIRIDGKVVTVLFIEEEDELCEEIVDDELLKD